MGKPKELTVLDTINRVVFPAEQAEAIHTLQCFSLDMNIRVVFERPFAKSHIQISGIHNLGSIGMALQSLCKVRIQGSIAGLHQVILDSRVAILEIALESAQQGHLRAWEQLLQHIDDVIAIQALEGCGPYPGVLFRRSERVRSGFPVEHDVLPIAITCLCVRYTDNAISLYEDIMLYLENGGDSVVVDRWKAHTHKATLLKIKNRLRELGYEEENDETQLLSGL